jgi:hypothetical protein
MWKFIRVGQIALGIFLVALAAGFYFEWSWATALWPWPGYYSSPNGLSLKFLSAVSAALAAATLWISLSGEEGTASHGAITLIVMFSGIGVFMFQSYSTSQNPATMIGGIVGIGIVVTSLAVFFITRQVRRANSQPMPALVRLSFFIFAATLFLVGTMALLKTPNVLPWSISTEGLVIYGWVFFGSAAYFLIPAIAYPTWNNASGQLIGFLAYDLVLILPLIAHFPNVLPENRLSLILYLAVLIYSALLAIYYLFLNKETRIMAGSVPEQARGYA